jgi:hypothetical protein
MREQIPIEVLEAEASQVAKSWVPDSPTFMGRDMSTPGSSSENHSPSSEGNVGSPSVSAPSPLPTHPSPPQLVKAERPPSPPPPERYCLLKTRGIQC